MSESITRRKFIRDIGTTTAAFSVPVFLEACGSASIKAGRPTTPRVAGANPFAEVFGIDDGILRRTLSTLSARGADHADLYFERRESNSIRYQDGIVSQASTSVDLGVGLRCVVGDQTGYAYTEELTESAMQAAAQTAALIAHGKSVPGPQQIRHKGLEKGFYSTNVPWRDVGIDKKLPIIRKTAELAQQQTPAVKKVQIRWMDGESRVMIATLDGNVVYDERPMAVMSVTVTVEKDGKTQSNNASIAGRRGLEFYTQAQLEKVTKQAVDRTMILFEAGRPPAGEMPVVLAAGPSGILLHEAIGHGMEADFNRKGVSIYSERIGQKVAEPFVNIIDDGTVKFERGAIHIDDEGKPAQRTTLVENGYLRTYLHDQISAKQYKVKPTGSGRRESFRHSPMPRMRCTFMEDGPHSREEVIASAKNGILAETFTNGQVEIGAGDYTFYIKNGYRIENGKLTEPIKDINIIGNGPETLRRITMAANDGYLDSGGWTCGKNGQSVPVSQGIPTVLVSALTVGGENG